MWAKTFSISRPCDPPTSASQSAGITVVSHQAWPTRTVIFKIQQEGRREDPEEAVDESAQVSRSIFLRDLESNDCIYPNYEAKVFPPLCATT